MLCLAFFCSTWHIGIFLLVFGRHTICVKSINWHIHIPTSNASWLFRPLSVVNQIDEMIIFCRRFLSHSTSRGFKGHLVARWFHQLGFYPAAKLHYTPFLYDLGTLKCILVEVEVHVGKAPLCRDWHARHLNRAFQLPPPLRGRALWEHLDMVVAFHKTYQSVLGEFFRKPFVRKIRRLDSDHEYSAPLKFWLTLKCLGKQAWTPGTSLQWWKFIKI